MEFFFFCLNFVIKYLQRYSSIAIQHSFQPLNFSASNIEDEKCEPSGKFSVSLKAGSKRSGGKIEDKKSVFINIGKKKSDLHTEALASKKLTVVIFKIERYSNFL